MTRHSRDRYIIDHWCLPCLVFHSSYESDMEELSRPSSNKRSRQRRDEDDLYMPRSARPSRADSRLGGPLSKSTIVPDERSVLRLAYYMKEKKLNQRSAAKMLGIR